jgi:proline iminopeptidase
MPNTDIASGATLYYEEVGGGRPCLVAHGGPGLHHGVYRSLDRLGEIRRLVYWDHRGHGRSGPLPVGEVTMSLFADDAIALADALDIESFAMFGHSFGGWVALEAALRHPDRVSALVLVATTPGQLGSTESPDDEEQGEPMPREIEQLLLSQPATDAEAVEVYRALAPHFMRSADPALLLDELKDGSASADSMQRVFGALAVWSAIDRLDHLECPTLLLAGRHDVFCSPPQLGRIARRVPSAELVVFQESGHFIWFEEPKRFFGNVVGPWLGKH